MNHKQTKNDLLCQCQYKMYYLIVNKNNHKYYCNRSSNPQRSIDAHIRRANNPNSATYYSDLHIALREEGTENFNFYSLNYIPTWVKRFTRYME